MSDKKPNFEIRDFGPVRFIPGDNRGRYPFCNSIYIEEAGILIDPSSNYKYLKSIGNTSLQAVWLTHWHEDHIMFLDLFKDTPIWMHQADEPPITDLEIFIDWYGAEGDGSQVFIDNWRKIMLEQFHYHPRKVDQYLTDSQIIDLDCVTVEIIHCPGHSPGSLSFFFKEPGILFIGDTDLTPFGPWYGDRYSNIDQIIATVKKLRKIPAKIWLTGHEYGIFETNPDEIWDNYLGVIQTREDKLLEFLSTPRTLDEIAEAWIIYGKSKDPVAEFLMMERICMRKHAERLIKKGKVVLDNNRYHRI